MKLIVLNGSPKGDFSVTMQYIHFIQNNHPEHEFKIINIASAISAIENDTSKFDSITDEIKNADGVLWAFPLYYWLVHSGYKRFIELINERKAENAFHGKYAASFSTSIHFFDHTAHNYIEAVSNDLDMNYTGFYSAAMHDLLIEKERKQILSFFEDFLSSISNKIPTEKSFLPVAGKIGDYKPGLNSVKIKTDNKNIVIVADFSDDSSNLAGMAGRFQEMFDGQVQVININNIRIKGGCLGCIKCGFDNICVYGENDDVKRIYNTELAKADIIVYALHIVDRYFSSRFKMFLDRSFMNGHQPRNFGKQIAYIVSGPLSQIQNLRQIMQGYAEITGGNFAGSVTDESGDSSLIDGLLHTLAWKLVEYSKTGYEKTGTFLKVGGMKIFRDEIYSHMRFAFQGDYSYYKKYNLFDFPQKNLKARFFNLIMIPFSKIPPVRESIRKEMIEHMVSPYRKIVELPAMKGDLQ